jgi:prepilin-type processing-associated H-X9-DG protein
MPATIYNNVPQAMYLLLRTEDLTAAVFNCPSTTAQPDLFMNLTALNHSNFDVPLTTYLSYSFASPYPAANSSYHLTNALDGGFAVAADINPGITSQNGTDNVLGINTSSSAQQLQQGNSNNHQKAGQNVLFADGHVEFDATCLVGENQDNIYTPNVPGTTITPSNWTQYPPLDLNDSFLLPTDDNS